ncbi:MAG TPA: hypothetical protein VFV75_03670 [Candidatus Polarisedimenticolaceae bacterium]|nr:hypothetical protein [Candidatus Polarisedimenticolaceae bacterium]
MSVAAAVGAVLLLATTEVSGLEGTFALDRAASDDVKVAVERSAQEFNFLLRPFARSRLTKANPVPRTVRIAYTPKEVSVQLDAAPPVVAPRDGRHVTWIRDDGARFELSARTEDGALRQSFEGDDGARTNVYRLRPDGKLAMEVTLTSPRLDKPLTYTLVFGRTSP